MMLAQRQPGRCCLFASPLVGLLLIVLGLWESNISAPRGFAQEKSSRAASRSLADSPNPFLRKYSNGSVRWQEWGNDCFDRSRQENKPVFLVIGHFSSPGLRTLHRKVFANEPTARFLNENFVNVLVDREVRPDLANLYHGALETYLEQTGSTQPVLWPVVLFLTPEGKPLGGGSTYTVEDQEQQAGLLTVLKRVQVAWIEEREGLTRASDDLTHALQEKLQAPRSEKPPVDLTTATKELSEVAEQALFQGYDEEFSGFLPRGPEGPKFAGTDRLLASLRIGDAKGSTLDPRIQKTLEALLDRGLLDQLGGGFFTHCRDREWRIPHFEKRLVDNLRLAELFAEAHQRTEDPRFRKAAEETLSFILTHLALPQGGFAVALSDETPEGEAGYYLWTREEIQEELPPEEFAVVRRYYALNDSPHLGRAYVLRQAQPLEVIADELGLTLEQVRLRLKQGQTKLLDVRMRRTAPERDDKVILASNGLAVHVLVRCGMLLNRPEYLRSAEKCAMFLLKDLRDDGGRLRHVWMSDGPHGRAFLEDYAALVQGLLTLYQANNDEKWLNAAVRLHRDQTVYFRDDTGPGFFQTARDDEDLLVRFKPWRDTLLPSGNALALQNQVELARLNPESSATADLEADWEFFSPVWRVKPDLVPGVFEALSALNRGSDAESVVRLTQAGGNRRMVTLAAQKQEIGEDESDESTKGAAAKKKKNSPIDATVYLSYDRLVTGEKIPFIVRLKIKEGWHINANKPGSEFAIPTELTMDSKSGTKIDRILFPKGKKVTELEETIYQYLGQVDIKGLLVVPEKAAGKEEELTFSIDFQICNETRCEKDQLTVTLPIEVAAEGESPVKINKKLFEIPQK